MSLRLKKQIAVELEQLNHLLDAYHDLIAKCGQTVPDRIEMSALAAMLHSFYTGIENIFKRTAMELDHEPPQGEAWHRELLRAMASPNTERPALLSDDMHERLKKYLDFRHVFRHAYSFELQWKRMSYLVLECEQTLQRFEKQISGFLKGSSE